VTEAAADDVVFVLLPDEVISQVFERAIAPALRPASAIALPQGTPMSEMFARYVSNQRDSRMRGGEGGASLA
jgi:ketol-acid reductoisomerase